MNKYLSLFLGIIFLLTTFGCDPIENATSAQEQVNQIGWLVPPSMSQQLPKGELVQSYIKQIEAVLRSPLPVILLESDELKNNEAALAQSIAIHNRDFLRDVNKRGTGEPLHSEIMSVRPASVLELANEKITKTLKIYRVELYNFYYNTSTIAYIDVAQRKILKVNYSTATPNVVNVKLQKIAKEIALSSQEVLKVLGKSRKQAASLPFTVNSTKCERSRHLCTAPTFKVGNKELWVIVDLTDLDMVGYDWVVSNPNRPTVVTERSLQNEFVVDKYCDTDNKLKQNDWDITYTLTGSDGLEIKNVEFKGKPVLESAKLVDWHVTYEFKEGFGYSDATGCPMFSAAAVVAFNGPEIEEIKQNNQKIGFALIQDFRSPVWPLACNYRYQNRFEFYDDGRFRITGVNLGLGCGNGGWYRPVFRIALSGNGTGQKVARWQQNGWKSLAREGWALQDDNTVYSPDGYLYKITTSANAGYYLEPGRGQFNDGGRGDNAYTYITVNHRDGKEGENNMPTIGSCCNTDYRQGPEAFLTPEESLEGRDITLWYVPQMPNDDTPGSEYCWVIPQVVGGHEFDKTFAGIVGPMFVPFTY